MKQNATNATSNAPLSVVRPPDTRPLPYSEDGEKGVLCSLFLSLEEVGELCLRGLGPDVFYYPAHRIVYELLLEFREKSMPADFYLIKQALEDRGLLDEVGGKEFLNEVYAFIPTSANAGHYIDLVREKYLLRVMILACRKRTTVHWGQVNCSLGTGQQSAKPLASPWILK